jgi:hypothetical protein
MNARHIPKLIFTLGCLLSPLSGLASADDVVAQARALKLISESASDICNTVEKEGSSQSTDLSGDVKAKLGGVIGKIADLGVEGAGKFSSAEYRNVLYRNVLQQDLAKTLQSNAECKLSVFKLLQEKMIEPTSGSSSQRR